MIVIRRLVDRHRAYTGIFLRGEEPHVFPTSDYEHARILAIFKQDRLHEGIVNDFSEYVFAHLAAPPQSVSASPDGEETTRPS